MPTKRLRKIRKDLLESSSKFLDLPIFVSRNVQPSDSDLRTIPDQTFGKIYSVQTIAPQGKKTKQKRSTKKTWRLSTTRWISRERVSMYKLRRKQSREEICVDVLRLRLRRIIQKKTLSQIEKQLSAVAIRRVSKQIIDRRRADRSTNFIG